MGETLPRPEKEVRKEQWLADLSEFIVEANRNTWAAEGAEVYPQRPGYKELEYEEGEWKLRDSYTGYFRAPGMTTVYYKGVPVWTMTYGGEGQIEGHEDKAKETFSFLKQALMRVTPEMPIRGPELYQEGTEGRKLYSFALLEGDLSNGRWREQIIEDGAITFRQRGDIAIVVDRNENREPVYPWDL